MQAAAATDSIEQPQRRRRLDCQPPGLSLRGDRNLNHAIDMVAVCQLRHPHSVGRGYFEWRVYAGKTNKEALRAVSFDDPDRLGRGFGTEVTSIWSSAFATLALQRIDLAVLEFNERAIRCYEQCGFLAVGRVANAAVVDGQPYDDILMALFPGKLVQ